MYVYMHLCISKVATSYIFAISFIAYVQYVVSMQMILFTSCVIILTHAVPAPTSVVITQVPSGSVTAGEALNLTCAAVLADSITSPIVAMVEWTVNDGQQIPLSSRVSISRTYALTPAIFASMLSFSPLLMGDGNTYTCQVFFRSVVESSAYLTPSDKVSDSYRLSVDGEFSYPFLHYNINVAIHVICI